MKEVSSKRIIENDTLTIFSNLNIDHVTIVTVICSVGYPEVTETPLWIFISASSSDIFYLFFVAQFLLDIPQTTVRLILATHCPLVVNCSPMIYTFTAPWAHLFPFSGFSFLEGTLSRFTSLSNKLETEPTIQLPFTKDAHFLPSGQPFLIFPCNCNSTICFKLRLPLTWSSLFLPAFFLLFHINPQALLRPKNSTTVACFS